jgi:hypothetical protein
MPCDRPAPDSPGDDEADAHHGSTQHGRSWSDEGDEDQQEADRDDRRPAARKPDAKRCGHGGLKNNPDIRSGDGDKMEQAGRPESLQFFTAERGIAVQHSR